MNFISPPRVLLNLLLIVFGWNGAMAQIGHWEAPGVQYEPDLVQDGWENRASGNLSPVYAAFTSEMPLLQRGGLKLAKARIALLEATQADTLFDFRTAAGDNDRKDGQGVSFFLAFRTPAEMGTGMRFLLGNGQGPSDANRGVSLAIGVNQFFNVTMGDGKSLFDGEAVLAANQTYVVVVNYNARTQTLEMYNTLSKRIVSQTTIPGNFGKNLPLLLGGLNAHNNNAEGTYYELQIFDRAISAPQMTEEAERLRAKWESRSALIQHLDAGAPESIEKNGAEVLEWRDRAGAMLSASPQTDFFLHTEATAPPQKAAGVSTRHHSASMVLQPRHIQRSWLDFSAAGEARDHTGFTIITTVQPTAYHDAWNEFFGHNKIKLRTSNEGFTGVQVSTVSMGRNYQIPAGEVVTYTLRYDAQREVLEFWNSGSQSVLTKPLPKGDFSSDVPLRLGYASSASQFFKGELFEVKLFEAKLTDEALSAEQAKQREKWTPTVLPIEVLGVEGTIESASFFLDAQQAEVASELWVQANNLVYENKGSVRINGGTWMALNHDTVTLQEQEAARGGMNHGGFHTIRFRVPYRAFQAGLNQVEFRFNESDGLSVGYRVLDYQVLDYQGNELLQAGQRKHDDPLQWEAPYSDVTSAVQGEMLWHGVTSLPATLLNKGGRGAALWNHYKEEGVEGFWHGYALPVRKTMKATCADCHTQDGRDLEMFAYSNRSIVERSKYHGLTANEGKKIASYIRSLSAEHANVERVGRPWNPPYQPGPQVAQRAIHNWAAGAGLDAVLTEDAEMVPFLFGTAPGENPSLAQVKAFFNTQSGYDSSLLPLSIQFPDWKHWLPMIHPLDAFRPNADGTSVWYDGLKGDTTSEQVHPYAAIASFRSFLGEMREAPEGRIAFLRDNEANLSEFIQKTRNVTSNFRNWWAVSATEPSHWRSKGGVATRLLEPDVPREWASSSLAKVQSVKQFEHYNEFDLQDMQYQVATPAQREKLHIPPRHWLTGGSYQVYPTAPHFVAAGERGIQYRGKNIPSVSAYFLGQPPTSGRLESTAWYEVQAVLTPGNLPQNDVSGPVHYNYQMPLIYEASQTSEVYEGMRYFHTANRMYQTILGGQQEGRTNGWKGSLAPSDLGRENQGFELRTMAPFYLFGLERKLIESADHLYPDLGSKIAAAHIEQFVSEMEKRNDAGGPLYDLERWPRTSADYAFPEGQEKNATLDHQTKAFYNPDPHVYSWADKLYRALLEGVDAGVEISSLSKLKDWCAKAWPMMPWDEIPLGDRAKIVLAQAPSTLTRNAAGESFFRLENIGTSVWSSARGYRVGLQKQEGRSFSVQTSGNGLTVQAGSKFLVAWSAHNHLSRSHWLTLPAQNQAVTFSLQVGNFTNDPLFKAPQAVELYRSGEKIGELRGPVPAPGTFVEWSYTLGSQATAAPFEVRMVMGEGEGNMAFDHFQVTRDATGEVLYEDLVEGGDSWEVTSGSEAWDILWHDFPAGVEVAPGEQYLFSLPLQAPSEEGRQELNLRMLNLGSGWFGQLRLREVEVISYLEAWRRSYRIGAVADPHQDTDRDGRSDLKEYMDGSDPTRKDSNPQPFAIQPTRDGEIHLQFSQRQDRDVRYVLMEAGEDFRFSLCSKQPAQPTGDDGILSNYLLRVPKAHRNRFFRLEAQFNEP